MKKQTNRHNTGNITRRLFLGLGALFAAALILGPTTPAHAAPGDKLIGKWKAKSMQMGGRKYPVKAPREIIFEYKKGGKFITIMNDGTNKVKTEGSWKATATTVTMTVKKKTETANYKVSGKKLRLETKVAGRATTFHMVKVP